MKIFLTDISNRKTFDVFNCLKQYNYEFILTDHKQIYANRIIYNHRINILRKNNINNFCKDIQVIQKSVNDKRIIYIPIEEDTTLLFYKYIKIFGKGKFVFALPNRETFNLSRDKILLNRFCSSNGIPCPKEYCYEELKNKFKKVVVKPRLGSGSNGLLFINKKKELELIKNVDRTYLVQEKLNNTRSVEGAFFLFKKGKYIDYYGHKRIRTYPIDAGVTVYSKISYNEQVKQIGTRLLQELNWHGIAMIEFLFDPVANQYKVIEINPRLWGSILLSEYANTGFLKNYINISLNKQTKLKKPRKNVFIRWFFPFDLINYIKNRKKLSNFWRISKYNTCYIGFTYSNLFRSLIYLLFSIVDIEKIYKFKNKIK